MRDIIRPVPPPAADEPSPPLATKLAWFVALTAVGVGATAAVAYSLRWLLGAA